MYFSKYSLLAMAATALAAPSTSCKGAVLSKNPDHQSLTNSADLQRSNPPRNFGVVMYNSFDLLDISGSVEPLFLLSSQQRLNLSLIAETLEPVHMRPAPGESYTAGSHFQLSINPTHTFADPPPDIDVLFVPGGGGERFGDNSAAVDFVRRTYPKVRYLITVCTGAGVAAQAGVLDGKRATTNKWAWKDVVSNGNNVQWTSPARWVVDGNIWTASGVVSGIDVIFEFMETFYGEEIVHLIQNATEHKRTYDPCDDPFAAWNKVPPSGDCRLTPYLHHE